MTLAAVCVLALVSNVIAPSVVAEMRRRDADAELARNRESLRAVATSMAELTRVSATLGTIERFAGSRRSMLRYLALLADALPESTAVLSIRADSVAATVVLVTRAGPAVVERLSSVAMVEAPQILGPFSREQVGGVEVERVATRSSFRRTVSREAPDQ